MSKRYLANDMSHAEINRVFQLIQKDLEGNGVQQNLHSSPFVTVGTNGSLIGVPHNISAPVIGSTGVGASGTPNSPGSPMSAGLVSGGETAGASGATGPIGPPGAPGAASPSTASERWLRRRGL